MPSRPTADAQALRELERVPLDLPAGLELAWLGVFGYRLAYQGVSVFIDPYVSRVPLRALVLRRRALPDQSLVGRYLSARTSTMRSCATSASMSFWPASRAEA